MLPLEYDTPLGVLMKIGRNVPIPAGFRVLSMAEGRRIKPRLNQIMGEFEIVGLLEGVLCGDALGNEFRFDLSLPFSSIFVINTHVYW